MKLFRALGSQVLGLSQEAITSGRFLGSKSYFPAVPWSPNPRAAFCSLSVKRLRRETLQRWWSSVVSVRKGTLLVKVARPGSF